MKLLVQHSVEEIVGFLKLNHLPDIAAERLQNATFFQYGSALFIKLAEGTVLLSDFFSSTADYFFYYQPESGLPEQFELTEADVYYLEPAQLGEFLQFVANGEPLFSGLNFDSQLLSSSFASQETDEMESLQTIEEMTASTGESKQVEAEFLPDQTNKEIDGLEEPFEFDQSAELKSQSFSDPDLFSNENIVAAYKPHESELLAAPVAVVTIDSGPVSLSRLSSDTDSLGSTSAGLNSVSGDSGSLVSRATVDGDVGVGQQSAVLGSLAGNSIGQSVDGLLNSFQLSSVVPLSDALPGEAGGGVIRTELEIDIDGQYRPTDNDLMYGKITFKSLTTDAVAVDSVFFDKPESWAHFYKGSFYVETSTSPEDGNLVIFKVDGSIDPANQMSNFYSPDYRHGAKMPIVENTNITLYKIVGKNEINEHYAVSGVGDHDFVALNGGYADDDTLSFFNKTDPVSGDGDYDLVTNNNYLKITAIENLEARGYGTNLINLNKTVVKSITTEKVNIIDTAGNFSATPSAVWTLSVAGDSSDVVLLTDEQAWQYNGVIDLAGKIRKTIDIDVISTANVDSTRDQYGNILYQFHSSTGVENYYLNVSADFGDHPDWYWSGTASAEAYELPDTQFGAVDFGAGIDTLEINSGLSSKTQDFTGEGGDLANVEIINFTNTYFVSNSDDGTTASSQDNITVDLAFSRGATDSDNSLSLIGDSIDTVTLSDIATNWHYLGTLAGSGGLSGHNFKQYQYKPGSVTPGDEQVTLNIDTDMAAGLGEYYRGWDGDDGLKIFSMSFDAIEAGAGTDTIRVDAATQDYTQAGISTKINNIEVIDGAGHTGVSTITVNSSFIAAATDSHNQLTVLGESGIDKLLLQDSANWNYFGEVTAFGETLYQYKTLDQSSTLNVQKNLATTPGVFFNGTNSDNNFFAPDLEFSSLDGKGGTDWLFIQSNDYDFTGHDSNTVSIASKIDNLEVIDARDNSSNQPGAVSITLNAVTVAAIAGVDSNSYRKLTVMGDSDDSVTISDMSSNWSWIGLVNGIEEFTGKQFYQYQSLDGSNVINIWDNINSRPEVRAIGDIGGVLKHDIIQVEDTGFSLVDGKTGTDTLQISQAGAIDLTGAGAKIDNIEVIDITGNASALIVDADLVQQLNSSASVVIQGDSGDQLNFSDTAQWRFAGSLSASGPWSELHAYQGTASDNSSTWLYAESDLGAPLFDAIGTSGNDLIQLLDKEDANVDGQTGFDTLQLLGNNSTVNLGSGKTIQGIEQLKLGNASQQTVSFDLSSVDNADNNALYVQGDSGQDIINAATGVSWELSGRQSFSDAPDMYRYQNENNGDPLSLYIQTDLVQGLYQTPTATTAGDQLWLLNDQFGSLNGQNGFDRLLFAQQGAIDLSTANVGNSLRSIEAVDMTNGVTNSLSLSTDTVILNDTAKNEFYILGESGDTLNLASSDNWVQRSSYQVSNDLSWDSYSSTSSVSGSSETATVYVDSNVGVNVV